MYSTGSLTLTNCTVSGNSTGGDGGGYSSSGGGIFSTDTLTLTNCTVSGNAANPNWEFGGDVYHPHYSPGSGGGISSSGAVTLTNCTVSGNSAGEGQEGGVSISSWGTLTATSSIFDNTSGGILASGSTFISHGHNLFSDAPGVTLDPTDLINTDPLLGPLADNGGPTQTMALLPGSPAIDAGLAMAGVTTDQRGVALPRGVPPTSEPMSRGGPFCSSPAWPTPVPERSGPPSLRPILTRTPT